MTDIQFYYLSSPLERVLPKLLEKALAGGFKIVVRLETEEKAEQLSTQLWTHDPDSFLAHGTKKDGHSESQPIYLTTAAENPNGASLVIVTDGSEIVPQAGVKRVLDLVDAQDAAALEQASQRLGNYRALGLNVSCVRQNASGSWEKLAA